MLHPACAIDRGSDLREADGLAQVTEETDDSVSLKQGWLWVPPGDWAALAVSVTSLPTEGLTPAFPRSLLSSSTYARNWNGIEVGTASLTTLITHRNESPGCAEDLEDTWRVIACLQGPSGKQRAYWQAGIMPGAQQVTGRVTGLSRGVSELTVLCSRPSPAGQDRAVEPSVAVGRVQSQTGGYASGGRDSHSALCPWSLTKCHLELKAKPTPPLVSLWVLVTDTLPACLAWLHSLAFL